MLLYGPGWLPDRSSLSKSARTDGARSVFVGRGGGSGPKGCSAPKSSPCATRTGLLGAVVARKHSDVVQPTDTLTACL